MGRPSNLSSSIDSSESSVSTSHRDLSTDLRLGLSISNSHPENSSKSRSTLEENGNQRHQENFFVKVYMEGVPIGRKLDLFAHDGYAGLIRTLQLMFRTTILCPDFAQLSSNTHVLTYEDKEGDWMMVGDVPWEMFLTTVKRLKITRADRC
ncbi:indole-3-acetic acid inducible 31 isoform X2 [Tasmannia lanceolata]|uniref:indole-3-acetic acid inducible 31 isoform X2 n=1 Tax=Tasmannia lanceolata TaxID=3420 RepID=UPI00406486A1